MGVEKRRRKVRETCKGRLGRTGRRALAARLPGVHCYTLEVSFFCAAQVVYQVHIPCAICGQSARGVD
eukprot:6173827-Pleurochrysis_carterae.AAC.1